MRERVCRDDLTRQRDRAALLRRVAVARRGAARAEAGQRRRLTLEPGRKSESESESKSKPKSKPKPKPKPKSKSKPQAASRKPQAASETETETETEAEAEACANRTLGARA
ncbi:hypothetical protein J4761_28135 [Burkholderia pseudomallei]|uniref:hypothetical protein n=1 Tax=Burkholderia pseudomallei TaxID=28450 RepID=UPI001AAE1C8E|nr:hypothetical protein [Burkholderia pseudomallei]